ncbi:MAG: S8 family serine peptidase [Nitrospirota bacterium]
MKRLLIVSFLLFFSCGDQQVSLNQDPSVIGQESNSPQPLGNPPTPPLEKGGKGGFEKEGGHRKGELLVKFKSGMSKTVAQSLHRATGSTVKRGFRFINVEHVRLPHGFSVEDAIRLYRADPNVEYAEPNYIVRKAHIPNDPNFTLQWALHNTGQTISGDEGTITGTPDADIDAPEAWGIHTGNGNVIVAVIDTGVDYNHEDLKDNIWTNPNEVCGNGLDDNSNGYVDDCRGWNFAYPYTNSPPQNDPIDDDCDGHGSHVTGIIGAVGNNNIGVSGVNWNVKIMPVKVLTGPDPTKPSPCDYSGSGSIADVIAGIEYAVMMGAKVINASYTYPQSCTKETPSLAERDAIKAAGDAGVLFVAAAGNYGCNNDNYPFYPASHALNNIISVAASDQNDTLASWSNYGTNSVHVSAPGVNIYSTIRIALGSYDYISGTSMATPFVSGLAALVASYYPTLSYKQVRELILSSVDNKNFSIITSGRINAYSALITDINSIPPVRPNYFSSVVNAAIDLSWVDNSTVEAGYIIEKKIGNGTYSEVATLQADSTVFSDKSVSDGTQYFYRVRAYNNNGYSTYSNEVSATMPVNPPSGLMASAVSSSCIDLSWVDNSASEEGFRIERKTGAGGTYTEIAFIGPDTTSYTDTGLSSSTTYYYRLRASNSVAGNSAYSNEASAKTHSEHCFIATAAYGSYLAPEVQVLRKFRDDHLLPNLLGRAFVKFYYEVSPPLADHIRKHETLRTAVRFILTPIVYGIKYQGISIPIIIFSFSLVILIFIERIGSFVKSSTVYKL